MNDKATIMLLHGSKDPSWLEPFLELRDKVAIGAPGASVAFACLQFGSPTLEQAIEELAAQGIRQIAVVPVFISTRGHVAKDVPGLVESAKARYPQIKITASRAVGDFPAVQQAIIDCIVSIASQ